MATPKADRILNGESPEKVSPVKMNLPGDGIVPRSGYISAVLIFAGAIL